jgi:ABC-type multidrug transport system ATPase subunit
LLIVIAIRHLFKFLMNIKLTNVSKRYNRDWIFRNLSYTFIAGNSYAITGPNGSGKSTLLQVIAGSTAHSDGEMEYKQSTVDCRLSTENLHQHLSIAAPYLEVVEEMTASEFLQFHSVFKPLSLPIEEIIAIVGLEKANGKQIRYYSSGMKQRVKLAQAIFSNTPLLLLDEPCTNLDKNGYQLYHQLVQNYCSQKLIIVSSNDENEMDFCEERLTIMDWK